MGRLTGLSLSYGAFTVLFQMIHVRAQAGEYTESFYDRIIGGPSHLTTLEKVLLGLFVTVAFEFLDFCAKSCGNWLHAKQIPVRGKHLDHFSTKDLIFIGFSKANTAPFTYFYFNYAWKAHNVPMALGEVGVLNTVFALVALFLVFDFVYTLLHWALHIKSIYGLIHKHHHTQKAPSRAAVDAINVHPVEYVLGEYNHLLALIICTQVMPVHLITTLLFLGVGGMLAALNHTRHDVVIRMFNVTLYDSKVHDVHHRIPQSNYGQYTMFWDHVFGSFRPYDPNDRISPSAQLDPSTGKSIGKRQ